MNEIFERFDCSLDPKGRFLLPSGFRKQLENPEQIQFVINCGFEHCLNLYTAETWKIISRNISRLNDLDPDQRRLKRMLNYGVTHVSLDSAGRILLQKYLLDYSKITKDIVFNAQGNKVEIWDRATYDSDMATNLPGYSDTADKVNVKLGGTFDLFATD
jgi:MraZ protein